MNAAATLVREVDRWTVQRWLPLLDRWLLDGRPYGVQHTWPQLYRSDGDGLFFVACDGERLLSHCACRVVTLHDADGPRRVALLGSVATDPEHRGRGHASAVLTAALDAVGPRCELVLLWAERPELYRRHGCGPGREETCLLLARRPRADVGGVRPATPADPGQLHALHRRKPMRIERSPGVMSGLLTTPGMTTLVLERGGQVAAYACCGKGADLQGHWHELGGSDEALAELLPAAMHATGQIECAVLVPPYRSGLRNLLGHGVLGEFAVPGPMVRPAGPVPPLLWVDGLDSV
jgi:GNAT superfamily N-acetyltransferase